MNPDNAVQGQSLSVGISGTYSDFNFYSGETRFRLVNTNDGSEIISNLVWEWDNFYNNQVIAYFNIPNDASIGVYDLEVANLFNCYWYCFDSYITNAFTINAPPSILTVSPDEVLVNSGPFSMTIVGENTQWLSQNLSSSWIRLEGNYNTYCRAIWDIK